MDPANIRTGTTDSAWVQNIGTERINAAEYNSAFAEGNTQQTQANSTLADPSLSLRTSPQTGVAISGESSVAPTTQQVLQQAIADMHNRPMDPKSYNALFSYKNQLQHVNTTEKLLNQKREILRQQQAAGKQTWQTEFDIKTLEKKLVSEQGKLQKKMRDPALQQVVNKTATQMQCQQALAVDNSRENILDFSRTYDKITKRDVNSEWHSGSESTDTDSAYSKVEKVKCRNERLEGQKHPVTGVPFTRTQIDVDGKQIEVVVPEFESYYEAQLPEEMYMMSDKKQFKESNRQLRDEIAKNPDLYTQFSEKQLSQIGRLETPDGYTWHHDAKTGTMQLVDRTIHEKTGHTGGRSLWGGGTGRR